MFLKTTWPGLKVISIGANQFKYAQHCYKFSKGTCMEVFLPCTFFLLILSGEIQDEISLLLFVSLLFVSLLYVCVCEVLGRNKHTNKGTDQIYTDSKTNLKQSHWITLLENDLLRSIIGVTSENGLSYGAISGLLWISTCGQIPYFVRR